MVEIGAKVEPNRARGSDKLHIEQLEKVTKTECPRALSIQEE
jgi:hypothetical protein